MIPRFCHVCHLLKRAFLAIALISIVSGFILAFPGVEPAAAQNVAPSVKLFELDRQVAAHLRAKQYHQALSLANRYAAGIAKRFGRDHLKYADALRKLARIYAAMGQSQRARRLMAQANGITRRARLHKPMGHKPMGGPAASLSSRRHSHPPSLPPSHRRPQGSPQAQPSVKPRFATPRPLATPRPMVLPPRHKHPKAPAQIAQIERRVSEIARREGRDSFAYARAIRQLAGLHKRHGNHSRATQLFDEARRATLAARAKVPKKQATPSQMVRPGVYRARPLIEPKPVPQRLSQRRVSPAAAPFSRPLVRMAGAAIAPRSAAEDLAKYRRELAAARREALQIKRRYGVKHPKYVAALRKIARLYRLMGRPQQARRFYRAANAIERQLGRPNNKMAGAAPRIRGRLSPRAVINQRRQRLKQLEKALEQQKHKLPSAEYRRRKMALKSQWDTLDQLTRKPGLIGRVMKSRKRPPVYRIERQQRDGKVFTKVLPVKISRSADLEQQITEIEALPTAATAKKPVSGIAGKSSPGSSPTGSETTPGPSAPVRRGGASQPTDDMLLAGVPQAVTSAGAETEQNQTYKIVRVFYGTDRNDKGPSAGIHRYGTQRNYDQDKPFAYGVADVSIPRHHEPGELESPSIFRLEIRWNPERHVTLLNVDRLEKDVFIQQLRDRVQSSADKEAFIFVHGYNVDFEYAARRTAQIAHDLRFDGAPIFYSWPSRASKWAYTADETNVKWGTANLKRFIIDVVRRTGANRVHLIGHSMGTRALTEALIAVKKELTAKENAVLREIILAAPDIDADVFVRDIVPAMRDENRRITMYASSNDTALKISKQVHGNNRAGDLSALQFIPEGIDVIDASAVKTSFLGHSFFADNDSILADIRNFIIEKKDLAQRFYLKKIVKPFGTYWLFQNLNKM